MRRCYIILYYSLFFKDAYIAPGEEKSQQSIREIAEVGASLSVVSIRRSDREKLPDTIERNGEWRPRLASLSKAFNQQLDLPTTTNGSKNPETYADCKERKY